MSSAYIARLIPNLTFKRQSANYRLFPLYNHHSKAPLRCSIRLNSTATGKLSYINSTSNLPLLNITVSEMVANSLKKYANRTAVVDCEQNVRKTFVEYADDIDKLAAGLLTLGLNTGDRVGIWAPNSYYWLTTQYACAKTGIILVCLNPLFQAKELEACMRFTGVKALFVGEKIRDVGLYKILKDAVPTLAQSQSGHVNCDKFPDLRHLVMLSEERYPGTHRYVDVFNAAKPEHFTEVERLRNSVQTFDPVQLAFTSGTTGTPKAVILTHHAILNGIRFNAIDLLSDQADRLCNLPPFFHTYGSMFGSYMSMYIGNTLVIPSAAYSSTHVISALKDEKCNIIAGTPTMYYDIINNPKFDQQQMKHVTKVIVAGSPIPVELYRLARERFSNAEVFGGYSATEMTLGTILQKEYPKTPDGTVGQVEKHLELRVVDGQGRLVPWNTPGELQFRGYLITPGYWDNPEKTAEAMTADGFYKTGDVGVVSEDGAVRIVGRIKDVIIRGGENVYPTEIEDHLATHPKILESQIFGIPDERLGEQVCAWIMLVKGQQMTTEEVIKYCQGHLAPFKIPKYIKFVEDIPKLPTGKVAKNVMRDKMVASLKV